MKKDAVGGLVSIVCWVGLSTICWVGLSTVRVGSSREKSWQDATHTVFSGEAESIMTIAG